VVHYGEIQEMKTTCNGILAYYQLPTWFPHWFQIEQRCHFHVTSSMKAKNKKDLLLFALLPFLAMACGSFASDINYSNFNSPTGLIFQGNATLRDDFVRLTPSQTNFLGSVGGLWLQAKQPVRGGFETTFQFRITDKVRHGGDGFAFVLQSRATPSLGGAGSDLGFVHGGSAFIVKFDTYHWHRNSYVRYDEIAVLSCGGEQNPRDLNDPLGTVTAPELYSEGKTHTARVRYVPGHLQVFLDDLEKPLLTVDVKLEDFVSFDHDLAWVGFTASTGADSENHDILSWAFNQPGSASMLPQFTSTSSAYVPPKKSGDATANAEQATPVENLSQQAIDAKTKPAQLQMSVPSSVGLTHDVYASTDLVNWTPVTNLTLYFRDPNSSDYDHRFYQFREK